MMKKDKKEKEKSVSYLAGGEWICKFLIKQ